MYDGRSSYYRKRSTSSAGAAGLLPFFAVPLIFMLVINMGSSVPETSTSGVGLVDDNTGRLEPGQTLVVRDNHPMSGRRIAVTFKGDELWVVESDLGTTDRAGLRGVHESLKLPYGFMATLREDGSVWVRYPDDLDFISSND